MKNFAISKTKRKSVEDSRDLLNNSTLKHCDTIENVKMFLNNLGLKSFKERATTKAMSSNGF